jgi:hypothetical protein
MNVQELGSLGELIAAIATVCTLFYLGYQIRQSSKVSKGSSYHLAVEQTWQSVLTVVNNGEVRDLLYRVGRGDALSDEELFHLYWINIAVVYGFENIFRLQEEGLVDRDVWENLRQNELADWFRISHNWEYLTARKGPLAGRFREDVERLIQD